MIKRGLSPVPLFPVPVALVLLGALSMGSVACGDGGGGGTGGGGGGDGGAGGEGGNGGDTGSNATTTNGGGQAMLTCGDNLSFVASCRVEASTYTSCSDFFGDHQTTGIEAQCAAGNGTYSTTPCVLDDRAGACVFFNSALPDRCYVQHVAPPSAADFWEMTCPQAGGSWTPAE